MGRGRVRSWWWLAAVAVIAVVVAWLLYLGWRSPGHNDLATYGAFVFPVAAVVVGWFAWAWRKGKAGRSADPLSSEVLDRFADRLATAVQAQWERAAGERGLTGTDPIRVTWSRPSLPVAGPLTAAVGSHGFRPLPGLAVTREVNLTSGQARDLHAVYGGLRSGRLIIAGLPGSGKSGAAVLLLLAALRHRREVSAGQRLEVPVPVIFTVQDWDPDRQPAGAWLTGKLQGTYPLLASAEGAAVAAALLASGRITVILDGLDEISPALRPVALQALSRQATFRLVILSRTSEIAAAASNRGVLQGAAAVELNPVDPAEGASYLERTQLDPLPRGWQELTARIRADPDSPLSRALNSPLTLTLVKDTYQADDIQELLTFCHTALDDMPGDLAAEAVTDHLLDRVVPAAYARIPGQSPPPYDLATAQRVLARIAGQMNEKRTRDLNWWQIADWVPRTPRVLVAGLVAGLMGGLVVGLVFGLVFDPLDRLLVGSVVGSVVGLAFGLVVGLAGAGGNRPATIGKFRLTKALGRSALPWLVSGLAFGLPFGLAGGLPFWLAGGLAAGLVVGLVYGLVYGLVGALVGALVGGLAKGFKADSDAYDSLNPGTSRLGSRRYGLVAGLVAGLVVGLVAGLVFWLVLGFVVGALVLGLVLGLVGGLMIGLTSSETWAVSLASVQLAIAWHVRMRLLKFLDDALSRNVLRAVGPAYQFRHARLQDRLAVAAQLDQAAVPGRVVGGEADEA
jgi:hypothetical protein